MQKFMSDFNELIEENMREELARDRIARSNKREFKRETRRNPRGPVLGSTCAPGCDLHAHMGKTWFRDLPQFN